MTLLEMAGVLPNLQGLCKIAEGVQVMLAGHSQGSYVVAKEIIAKLFSREGTPSSWNRKCMSLEQ